MSHPKKLLVTGAGGFIGGRVVEGCHLSGSYDVRAGIRRWASAARLARFPVEIALCDVLDEAQVRDAIQGVQAVVHCALGDDEVTIQGTRQMLQAAHQHGVERFIHISTVEVYGDVSGELDETAPYRDNADEYGRMKIEAEKIAWQYHDKGLPVCVIRPSVVYGPFSKFNTIRFAHRLQSGRWGLFKGYGEGICNLVYVDDLVLGVMAALERDEAVGEAFNISGPDQTTWNGYIEALNEALGLGPLREIDLLAIKSRSMLLMPVRETARMLLAKHRDRIMKIYERYDLAKKLMKRTETSLKTTPTPQELKLYNRRAAYPIAKAKQRLGYEPRFDMRRGLEMSVRWLAHHGLASGR